MINAVNGLQSLGIAISIAALVFSGGWAINQLLNKLDEKRRKNEKERGEDPKRGAL